jgi:glutathione S-transferase
MDRFKEFLRSGDDSARAALEEELRSVEEALPNDHPFFGGKDVNAWDMAMAPRLYLARVGCKHLRNWDFAADKFPNILKYDHRMTGRPSWRNTASWNETSILEDLEAWKHEK